MNREFQRVCELFDEARRLPPGEPRARFLDEACEKELRADVDGMLDQHDAASDADTIATIGPELGRLWAEASAPPPQNIGPYRILREIGAGGSGTVYEAEQDSPRRRVAVKVLNASLSARARERFEREGEILGQLSHDGIARVFAMEEHAIVMELVDGAPITRHAQDLSLEERLALLIRVCKIVAHAHQKGVIHRDLKPSNILVTKDGDPKVLDFGLARRVESDGATMTGLVMGTLGYMSPEQANARPGEVDTRTDVYALGAIGYELLSGRLPHETKNRPVTEILLEIATEDAKPLSLHDRRFRGDLSLVFGKALARERERRYQSADAFAEDLRRYLADEPIVARSPAATYQLRKFVKRNKALVSAFAAAMIALLVGLGFALQFADERDRAAERAARALARARVRTAYADMRGFHPSNARQVLDLVPSEHRGWEWGYLSGVLDGTANLVPGGARSFDLSVESLPYWERPAWKDWCRAYWPAGCLDGGDHLFDVEAGAVLEVDGFPFAAGEVESLHASADGRRLIVSGARMRWARGMEPANGVLAFEDRRVLGFWPGHVPNRVALSPDGTHWACTVGEHQLRAQRVDEPALTEPFRSGHFQYAFAIAFSPDNRLLASGTVDSDLRLHDTSARETVRISRVHTGAIHAIAFSPDGRYVAAGGADETISLWDLSTGDETALITQGEEVRGLRFSADGERLWSVGPKGRRAWNIGGTTPRVLRHHRTEAEGNPYPYVYGVSFSADGSRLASGGWDGTVRVADAASGRLLRTHEAEGTVQTVAYTKTCIVATTRSRITSWREGSVRTRRIPWGLRRRIAARPGTDELAVASYGGNHGLQVYDARTLEPSPWTPEKLERSCHDADYSPDGKWLAVSCTGGVCLVYDADTGRLRHRIDIGERTSYAVEFGPEGRLLACGCDHRIVICDAESGRVLRSTEPHNALIYALAFHPDGSRLASGCADSTLRLWDPATGERVLSLKGHTGYIHGLNWSPDGTIVASGSGDNTVRLWRSE